MVSLRKTCVLEEEEEEEDAHGINPWLHPGYIHPAGPGLSDSASVRNMTQLWMSTLSSKPFYLGPTSEPAAPTSAPMMDEW